MATRSRRAISIPLIMDFTFSTFICLRINFSCRALRNYLMEPCRRLSDLFSFQHINLMIFWFLYCISFTYLFAGSFVCHYHQSCTFSYCLIVLAYSWTLKLKFMFTRIQLLFTQNVYLFSLTSTVYVYSHVQLSSSSMLLQSFSPLQIW